MIDTKDVMIYSSSTKGSVSIRVTHIPTGAKAEAHGKDFALVRREAMRLLEAELEEWSRAGNADTPL